MFIGICLCILGGQSGAAVPVVPSYALLETGDIILLETGDKLLLQ